MLAGAGNLGVPCSAKTSRATVSAQVTHASTYLQFTHKPAFTARIPRFGARYAGLAPRACYLPGKAPKIRLPGCFQPNNASTYFVGIRFLDVPSLHICRDLAAAGCTAEPSASDELSLISYRSR
jgi:hypothetical protein